MRYRTLPHLALVLLLASSCSFGQPPAPTPALPAHTQPLAVTQAPDAAPAATPTAAPAPAGEGEVVTISFGGAEFERPIYEPLIAQFNQENPGIRVQFVSLDGIRQGLAGGMTTEQMDAVVAQWLGQIVRAVDTASLYGISQSDMRSGLLQDLTPLADADPLFDREDFFPAAMAGVELEGRLYMVPQMFNISLVAYNKSLWAERGVPAPSPDWTWEDLAEAAERLAVKRGGEVEIYGFSNGSGVPNYYLASEIAASGIDLFNQPPERFGQIRLDQPAIVAALERVAALADSGAFYMRLRSPEFSVEDDEGCRLMKERRVGMWWDYLIQFCQDVELPPFEIGYVPYPDLPLPSYGTFHGHVMSAGAQHPEAAWRWLSFVSRQPIGPTRWMFDSAATMPARMSLAEQIGYWEGLDPETAAAVRVVLARSYDARSDNNDLLWDALWRAANDVLSGEKRAEHALADAQARLEERLAERLAAPTATPDPAPLIVATPPPELPASDVTTIVFGTLGLGVAELQRAAQSFNAQNSGVAVSVRRLEGGGGLAGMAAQSDCFVWPGRPPTGALTATLDIRPLLDADRVLTAEEFPPALLEPLQSGTALHGLPYGADVRSLAFDRGAFDAAGLAYPSASWTPDDFLAAAQQLTHGEGESKHYGYVAPYAAADLVFFLNRFGAAPLRGSGDAAAPSFTDPLVVQGVRWYIELLRDFSPHTRLGDYAASGSSGDETAALIAEGRAGMWLAFGVGAPAAGGDIQLAPPPLGDGPLAPEDLTVRGLYISAGTPHAEACWQWMRSLSADVAGLAGAIPARVQAIGVDSFARQGAPGAGEVYAAYRDALARPPAERRSSLLQGEVDPFWFFRAADRALQGGDLERELAEAQALTEQHLACVRGGGAPGACARQVDPSYDGWS